MTDPEETGEVRVDVYIDASPETVFAFLTKQEQLTTWLADLVEAVGRPGGRLRASGSVGTIEGIYLETIACEKVVFTWGGVEGLAPGQTIVEFRLEPEATGTRLKLRHYNLPKPVVDVHYDGWAFGGLEKLKSAAEGHPSGVTCLSDFAAHGP